MSNHFKQRNLWQEHHDQQRRKTPGETWSSSHVEGPEKVCDTNIEEAGSAITHLTTPVESENRKRTDHLLVEEIRRGLSKNTLVRSSDINVKVEDGDVYLLGVVNDEVQHSEVVSVVKGALGVKRIVNKLDIRSK